MDADGYKKVLASGLLPFVSNQTYVVKFMQDNDPKHTSSFGVSRSTTSITLIPFSFFLFFNFFP